jgi:hypothetical protein
MVEDIRRRLAERRDRQDVQGAGRTAAVVASTSGRRGVSGVPPRSKGKVDDLAFYFILP